MALSSLRFNRLPSEVFNRREFKIEDALALNELPVIQEAAPVVQYIAISFYINA